MASEADHAAQEQARFYLGRTISDRYRVDDVIAMGGMGAVYLGEHVLLHKRVAIKILHPDVAEEEELAGRFHREAVAGAHIVHPNVAAATDFGELPDGSRFLVTEFVRGRTLHAILREGPLGEERVVRIGAQIARALHAVHERGIVHRDVKPRNIMVNEAKQDRVKLIDFGLAKIEDARVSTLPREEVPERLTELGVIFGTVAYLAPEAAFGMDMVEAPGDLYALGVVLYEMLTGKHPFDATSGPELFAKQRHVDAPSFRERNSDIDVHPELERVVLQLLHKDFDVRPQSGESVAIALEEAMGLDAGAEEVPQSIPPSGPISERKPSRANSEASIARTKSSGPASSEAIPSLPLAPELPPPRFPAAIAGGALVLGILVGWIARGATYESTPTETAPQPTAAEPRRASPPLPLPSAVAPAPAPAASSTEAVPSNAGNTDSADESTLRTSLVDALEAEDWRAVTDALTALKGKNRRLLDDETLRGRLYRFTKSPPPKLENADVRATFEALGHVGPRGPDLLFAMVESGGRSRAARVAADVLVTPELREYASDTLVVAIDLRFAPCPDKLAAIDRAVDIGDERAATALDIIARGCFKNPEPVEKALVKLRDRLRDQ